MDIKYPFSVLQALSVVLSAFDKKIGCEWILWINLSWFICKINFYLKIVNIFVVLIWIIIYPSLKYTKDY